MISVSKEYNLNESQNKRDTRRAGKKRVTKKKRIAPKQQEIKNRIIVIQLKEENKLIEMKNPIQNPQQSLSNNIDIISPLPYVTNGTKITKSVTTKKMSKKKALKKRSEVKETINLPDVLDLMDE